MVRVGGLQESACAVSCSFVQCGKFRADLLGFVPTGFGARFMLDAKDLIAEGTKPRCVLTVERQCNGVTEISEKCVFRLL